MNNKSIPPFYVGQEVVSLTNGKTTPLKKDQVYTVIALKQFSCGCWGVDIGFYSSSVMVHCEIHNSKSQESCGTKWLHSRFFAPITSTFQSIEYREVLENERQLVSSN